ncbi:MAG: glycoside hydrolase family 3 C-terminal domain-containing protein [Clostridia bacterium]|nr:glycoside hydrolase family 3 C-terminal domain-containing protein [Clostridia bacterium]
MSNEYISRARALMAQMTLEEKVAQMMQIPYAMVGREEALRWAKLGAGSFLHVLGDDAREIQQAACSTRLGIPVIFGIDAVRGHALNDHATVFPTQLACACSWDRETAREMGRITAREVATDGLHWTFSPLLCLSRDPRWGRVNETFGEDPYLTGELAAAIIEGYQGDSLDDPESIIACAKHYFAYGEAVGARDACDSEITYRKAREVFLPPFKKAVDAGCASFMTAYGSIDGTPLTIDRKALHDILRGEMGFDGFVVTDWMNATSLVTQQFVAADPVEAARLAAEAGNDMIMSSPEFYESALRSIREGRLSESVIDEAVLHILTVKMRMELFAHPEKLGRPGCIGCAEHHEAALRAAQKSITLLRNDGVLPIADGVKTIAVIGGNADDIRAQYGDWTYFSHPLPNPEHEPIRPYTTIREGMEALAAARGIACVYSRGCSPIPTDADDLDAAVEAAKGADLIVYVVGDEVPQVGEGKDRADLALSGRQSELFARLRALGIPMTTVLCASKPLAMPEVEAASNAVVVAFNGGAHGGEAVAQALFGEINPQGRLPISFPHHSGQVPVYYNALPGWHKQVDKQKYCDLPETPLFAFGEGMGYAPFAYSDLSFDTDTLTARVTVKNTGSVEGVETVQVYFRDLVSSVMTPVKQLIAYKQVELAPGKAKTVEITLDRMDFSLVNRREERVVEPGEFLLMVGHSSRNEDLLTVKFALA